MVEQLPANQRLMGPLHHNPVLRPDQGLFVGGRTGLALHHVAGVDLVGQDFSNGPCLPLSTPHQALAGNEPDAGQVVAGGEDISLIQPPDNHVQRGTVRRPPENLPDYGGGILVHKQAVAVLRVLPVTVRRPGPHKLSRHHAPLELEPCLTAGLKSVSLVHDILDGQGKAASAAGVLAVIPVIDGNKSDMMERKIVFGIVSGVDGVAAQAGEVLHHDAVDFPGLDIRQHLLESLPVKGLAGDAVVNVNLRNFDVRAQGQAVLHNLPLRLQGIPPLAVILHGQADIECGLPYLYNRMLVGGSDVLATFPGHSARLLIA